MTKNTRTMSGNREVTLPGMESVGC